MHTFFKGIQTFHPNRMTYQLAFFPLRLPENCYQIYLLKHCFYQGHLLTQIFYSTQLYRVYNGGVG